MGLFTPSFRTFGLSFFANLFFVNLMIEMESSLCFAALFFSTIENSLWSNWKTLESIN